MKIRFDDLLREMQELDSSERELQDKKAKEMDEYRAKKKEKKDDVDEDDDEDNKKKEPIVAKDETIDVTLDGIISKINIIRSGTSLRSKEGKSDLKSYYKRLNDAERLALFAFLSGLADVMVSTDPAGADADTPADPFNVDIEIDDDEDKRKRPAPRTGGKGEKSPQPIVVGESANKSRELNILRGNR